MQSLAPRAGKMANIGGGSHPARWPGLPVCDARIGGGDFNTAPLPHPSESLDTIICEQVIEHLHNTTWFISELHRILKPGGTLLISTEDLCSWPNRLAMMLNITPFSLQPCCGKYMGGWKTGATNGAGLPPNHPCYSGTAGHVRVLSRRQLVELLAEAGFRIGPVHRFAFGHYILVKAGKP